MFAYSNKADPLSEIKFSVLKADFFFWALAFRFVHVKKRRLIVFVWTDEKEIFEYADILNHRAHTL